MPDLSRNIVYLRVQQPENDQVKMTLEYALPDEDGYFEPFEVGSVIISDIQEVQDIFRSKDLWDISKGEDDPSLREVRENKLTTDLRTREFLQPIFPELLAAIFFAIPELRRIKPTDRLYRLIEMSSYGLPMFDRVHHHLMYRENPEEVWKAGPNAFRKLLSESYYYEPQMLEEVLKRLTPELWNQMGSWMYLQLEWHRRFCEGS